MKVIILGSNGQLGSEFVDFLEDKVDLFSFSHKELDILNLRVLIEKFSVIKPDIVINCAAYTNVDKAEDEDKPPVHLFFLLDQPGSLQKYVRYGLIPSLGELPYIRYKFVEECVF